MFKNLIRLWAKHIERHFTEEGIQMANKPMRRCSKSFVVGKCQLKPQWSACIHLSKRLKWKIMAPPNVGEAEDRLDHSYISAETIKGDTHSAKHFGLKRRWATERWACLPSSAGASLWWGTVRWLGCVRVQVLAVMSSYCCRRWYHWGKRGKGHVVPC